MEKKLIIIGAGPSGMASALGAMLNGISPKDILIVDRDSDLGGTLNQCVHTGFGLHYFGENLTGTEYADRFVNKIKENKIGYLLNSTVLSITKDKEVTIVSPQYGYINAKADAIILAMGCRERPRGSLNIAGTRPAGIFSAGTAQKFVNIDGYLPGKNVVILGSEDIGLIMARRMTLEGAKVLCVSEIRPQARGKEQNVTSCLEDFDIPLYTSTIITEIFGKERVEAVEIAQVDKNLKVIKGTEKILKCDTLIISCGFIPENEISRSAGITIDRTNGGAKTDEFFQTDIDGIFACGNALHLHDTIDSLTEEAIVVGKNAAEHIKGNKDASTSVLPNKRLISMIKKVVANRKPKVKTQDPTGILTSTVKISSKISKLLPVKTDKPIDKSKFFDAMKQISQIKVKAPIKAGDIIEGDFIEQGTNLIATKTIQK